MDTGLTPAALDATKALVRLVLQRERQQDPRHPSDVDPGPLDVEALLDAVPRQALLAAIRRHRLECLLHGDPCVAMLLPDLASTIKAVARKEAMAALALASLTRDMTALFEQAGIPMLVIKGIPLALQTTGSLTARGRGDLDLLVAPKRLPEALELIQSSGFSLTGGASRVGTHTRSGQYSRFVSIEITLMRDKGHRQMIDLHWHPSLARKILPPFDDLWSRRDHLSFSESHVPTLSLTDAFVHACCHAAADRWMCLRNLVDVHRLSGRLDPNHLLAVGRKRIVRKSCAVTHSLAPISNSMVFLGEHSAARHGRALSLSREAQLLPRKSMGQGAWTLKNRIQDLLRLLNLSHHPVHISAMLMRQFVTPETLVDVQTGQTLPAIEILQRRIAKMRQRIMDNDATLSHMSDH